MLFASLEQSSMGTLPDEKPSESGSAVPPESGASTPSSSNSRGWVATYDSTLRKLPPAIATRLPTSETAASSVALAQDKLSGFGEASKQSWDVVAHKANALRQAAQARTGPARVEWLRQAWSITNETQVPLNISLNQVSLAVAKELRSRMVLTRPFHPAAGRTTLLSSRRSRRYL